jgi:hypothetical protein
MLALAPVPFAAFGALWYVELYGGLCRALAAPWLEPWWIAQGTENGSRRVLQGTAIATPPPISPEPAAEATGDAAAPGATIIPFDLARARAAAHRVAGRGPRR